MVTKPGPRKSSCNGGELDPLIVGRPDVKQYYSGGLRFKNVEPVPQSGFRQMPGSRDAGPVRGVLSPVAVVTENFFPGPFASVATVYQQTFAAAVVTGVNIGSIDTNVGTFTFNVEVLVAGVWTAMGGVFSAGTSAVSRFAAFPPGKGLLATAIRIRANPSTSATFTVSGVVTYTENAGATIPRYRRLQLDQDTGYFFAFGAGFADIWRNKTWVACVRLGGLSPDYLPDLDFYAEASTVGLFHGLLQTIRIRRAGTDQEWSVDLWPYDGIPEIDYGGTYTKTSDVWEVFMRWTGNIPILLSITVNGETIPAVSIKDSGGTPITTGGAVDWALFATELAASINNLPSITTGVTVSQSAVGGTTDARKFIITFGGDSSGIEYEFSTVVTNTADASALPTHTQIGKTGGEALISVARGWPGTAALMQDRLGYARLLGQPAAQLLSQVGEYFKINIKAAGDAAPRLDRLRSQTSELIYRIKESKYFLLFTNLSVYFAPNRTISANEPLNYVLASEIGIRPNTDPIDLEGLVYYVSNNGKQILSLNYDDVSTSYNSNPETLLSSHLIEGIARNARQVGSVATDTNRMWLMREDGRLLSANVIRNQEILGMCEWQCADGGLVREIAIDAYNTPWICVARDGRLRHEWLEEDLWFQQAVTATTDLSGLVTGLPYPNGTQVWAKADGFTLGPYTVQGGSIDLEDPYTSVDIGRWIAPVFEDMPHVLVTQDDQIIRRPGRIHTAYVNVVDTTSIAIGANNQPARDVPLLVSGDPVDLPMPAKTKLITVGGLLGHSVDTTLVITQVKPGSLRIRDYWTGEKL